MGEDMQQPAGLGKLYFCLAEDLERLGMDAPMTEIPLAEPATLSPGMLTYKDTDGKPKGGWSANISFHAAAKAEPDEVLQQLLQKAQTFDVTIERKLTRLPRKMKKAYRSNYPRNTKWTRKVANLIRRQSHTLHDCEVVVTPEQHDRLSRQLNIVTITPKEDDAPVSCHDCQHWQDGDDGPQCEYPDMPPCRD